MFWSPRRHGVHGAPCDWGIRRGDKTPRGYSFRRHDVRVISHDVRVISSVVIIIERGKGRVIVTSVTTGT